MKKYSISFLLLLIAPCVCFGSSARYTQLVRQKQSKMEQLEKCMGSNKALQIAGVSTLGLTAVGVAGNIYEAKLIKDNKTTIEKKDTTIAEKSEELRQKEQDFNKASTDLNDVKKNYDESHTLEQIVKGDAQDIRTNPVEIGTQAITHGYRPGQLPEALKAELQNAFDVFSNKCKDLENNNGIASVLVWENQSAENTADAYKNTNTVLYNRSDFVVMECKLQDCVAQTYRRVGNNCEKKEE